MKRFDVILDLLVQFGFLANAIYSLIVGDMTSAVLSFMICLITI